MTLGLSMIVKDETDSLIKLVDSIKDVHFDQKVAVCTSRENGETEKLLEQLGFKVSSFKWIDDFSAARNFSKSYIDTDWMMWLDADDTLEGAEHIIIEIEAAERAGANAIFADYVYDTNCPIYRERIVKTKEFEWRGILHEALYSLGEQRVHHSSKFRVNHDHSLNSDKERTERNLRLSGKAYLETPSAQSCHAYGQSLYESGNYKYAIEIFKEALKYAIHPHFQYVAICKIAYSYMFRNNEEKCLRWCNRALRLFPEIGEAMWIKAMCMMRLKRWYECIDYCATASILKEPENWIVTVNKNIYRSIGPNIWRYAVSKIHGYETDTKHFQRAFNEINA